MRWCGWRIGGQGYVIRSPPYPINPLRIKGLLCIWSRCRGRCGSRGGKCSISWVMLRCAGPVSPNGKMVSFDLRHPHGVQMFNFGLLFRAEPNASAFDAMPFPGAVLAAVIQERLPRLNAIRIIESAVRHVFLSCAFRAVPACRLKSPTRTTQPYRRQNASGRSPPQVILNHRAARGTMCTTGARLSTSPNYQTPKATAMNISDEDLNRIADLVVEKLTRRMAGPPAQMPYMPTFYPVAPYAAPQAPQWHSTLRCCTCPPGAFCGNAMCPRAPRAHGFAPAAMNASQ